MAFSGTPINFQWSLSPQRQWERMRVFHSRKLLWPTMERTGQTQVAGGSPLTWTTLYPPLTDVRLETYAWNGHLANYMPWTIGPEIARPPIISHARWNIRRSTSPLATANSPGGTHNHPVTPENPILQPPGDSQLYAKSGTPKLSAKAQSTQQPAHIQSHGLTSKQKSSFARPILHPTAPAPLPKPQPPAPTRHGSVLFAIMIYILLVQHSSTTGPAAQLSNPTAIRHWSYSCVRPSPVVQTQKSCSRRTMAIIQ